MKTNTLKITLALIIAMMFGTLMILIQRPWQAGASVAVGNYYQSTTTPTVADLTNLCPARAVGQASSTTGVLGSIVLTGPNIGNFQIYDATTTVAASRSADQATSTLLLADIPAVVLGDATSTGMTYTFDIEFKRGLLIDKVGSTATATISYRCEG